MKQSTTIFFLALLLFNLLFVVLPLTVKSEPEEWVLETRGSNFDVFSIFLEVK